MRPEDLCTIRDQNCALFVITHREFYELRHQPQAAVLEAEHRMAIGRWNAG